MEKYESESDLSASFYLASTKDLRKKLLWYIFAREGERKMDRKAVSGILLTLLLIGTLTLAFDVQPVEASGTVISVPYHRQITEYYCGPASLEMIFDFYGPDVPQHPIAAVAGTTYPWGTFTDGMRRASHFSKYRQRRGLGYAAFEHWGFTMEELEGLIDEGYPIIVLTWLVYPVYGHYRVVVGYDETHVMLLDPLYSQMMITHSYFLRLWSYSDYWGLFVSPWGVSVSASENVREGDIFTVTATATYPCPDPFHHGEYPASSSSATITLPEGLTLVSGETSEKTLGTGNLAAGNSATVSWMLRGDSPDSHNVRFVAEGTIAGFFSYPYQDRIGGSINVTVTVNPQTPVEATQELIEAIKTWNFPKGTEKSLTSKLDDAIHLLEKGNENGAIHKLRDVIDHVEALREKKLTNNHADQLLSEIQRIIYLVKR